MANQISGRVIALSQVKEVAGNDPQKTIKKRELYMDCTRYDPYSGKRSQFENKPLLEFGGDKVLAKLDTLNLQPNDIVTVSFDIQGTPYTDKTTGKMRVYTAIRCYDIEVRQRADGTVPANDPPYQSNHQPTGANPFPPQQAQQVQQPAQQQQVVQPQDDNGGLPF